VKNTAPYLIFGIAYFVLLFIAGVGVDQISHQTTSQVFGLLVPVVVAPMAIVVAKRVRGLSVIGVSIATILSALGTFLIITAIYLSLAAQVGGSVSLLSLTRHGGWPLTLGNLIYVLAPILWLQLHKDGKPQGRR
jgi:hypothetical protein